RIGITDLSVTTAAGRTYNFEVRVVMDLHILHAELRCLFPDARIKLSQLRDQLVVEGEARDTAQVDRIRRAIQNYLESIEITEARVVSSAAGRAPGTLPIPPGPAPKQGDQRPSGRQPGTTTPEL